MKHAILAGIAAVALGTAMTGAALAADISGAGATFPYPIYAKWADTYKTDTGIGLNYQSIGSGGGINQITARTVDFGASDAPLTTEQLRERSLLQFRTDLHPDLIVFPLRRRIRFTVVVGFKDEIAGG